MSKGIRNFVIFALAMIGSWIVGSSVPPTWTVEQITLDVLTDDNGKLYYIYREKPAYFDAVPLEQAQLHPGKIHGSNAEPPIKEEFVSEMRDGEILYSKLLAKHHWGYWSLLPAAVAVMLCWLTREPVTALLGGIVSGALILTRYDFTGEVLVPSLATTNAASILLLYLWLLGGLMGIWSRTGAAQAFAEFMTVRFVRGPKSAKLVAWMLGVIFFQGGTVSTVLVGTTVKPIADKEKISHEELAYIVDSTASPIASQLAFNAWPGYVQAFIFVAGVSFLATEADRLLFFFKSVPFCFYAIFAVLGTFLLSIEKPLFLGKQLKEAMNRSRETGQLDADDADPLSAKELAGKQCARRLHAACPRIFPASGRAYRHCDWNFYHQRIPQCAMGFWHRAPFSCGHGAGQGHVAQRYCRGLSRWSQRRGARLGHSLARYYHWRH